jgi:hypothetical protein
MPTTLSDFNSPTRLIRAKVEVDLNKTGTWQDYTYALDNYTILNTTQDKIYGVIEKVLDLELFLDNPSEQWSKPGIPVRVSILTSNDNWVTSHTEQLFYGTTQRQNSIAINTIKIRALSSNSLYLDKKIPRRVYLNWDINTIMEDLLIRAGVDIINISLPAVGVNVPVYIINDNYPIKYYIEDLCKPLMQVVGFNRNNVFTAQSLQILTTTSSTFTPDVVTNLTTITDYDSQELTSKYYANTITVKGRAYEYIEAGQLYYDNQISGQEIKPNERLYFTLELPDIQPVFINRFAPRNRPNSGSSPFVGGYQERSFYDFFLNDDGSGGADNTNVVLLSQSIAEENGNDVLFLKFKNNSNSESYYLKTIVVNGQGVKKVGDLQETLSNNKAINDDGSEIAIEIDSSAIQTDVMINNTLNTLKANITSYSDVFKFEHRGKPVSEIGKIIEFRDRNNNTKTGLIYELDTEVSLDRGYTENITAKVLNPVDYLELDNPAQGLDDNNYSIF